jgi:hypothetical protein
MSGSTFFTERGGSVKFRIKRTMTGVVGAVLGMLVVAAANVPAQAAPDASAPREVNVAAVAPGISPAAEQIRYVSDLHDYSCGSGRACFAVQDPTQGRYKVFDLFHCGTYNLSNWHGVGTFRNSQTGGAAVVLYDQNGPFPFEYPPAFWYYELNWDPVWRIKPC